MRIRGGEQRQASSETDAEYADLLAKRLREIARRVSNGVDGVRVNAVVGQREKLRGQNLDAAGGHGARERDEARLFDAEMMHPVNDEHPGRVGDAPGNIEAGTDFTGGRTDFGQRLFDRISVEAADSARMLRILDAQQKPGGAQIRVGGAVEQQANQKEGNKDDECDAATLRDTDAKHYCSFAYSDFASLRMGTSGPASFHSAKKSW